ncbi:MAG: hypothetical protein M3O91_10035 [Chloroflexota bacterium]|nr:hypothetical protein [Chloroflexota bacterium]
MRLRWDASPWLLFPVLLLLGPAAWLWTAALLQFVGAGRPLDAFMGVLQRAVGPDPSTPARLFAVAAFFGLPLVALVLAFFAFFGGELSVEEWVIELRLRLPRPPWSLLHAVAALLLAASAALALAVAAHAVAG